MKKFFCSLILSCLVIFNLPAQFINPANVSVNLAYAQASKEQVVAFNQKTQKFHKLGCIWAQRCTVNCITIPKSDAVNRGGIPCKVCGG